MNNLDGRFPLKDILADRAQRDIEADINVAMYKPMVAHARAVGALLPLPELAGDTLDLPTCPSCGEAVEAVYAVSDDLGETKWMCTLCLNNLEDKDNE